MAQQRAKRALRAEYRVTRVRQLVGIDACFAIIALRNFRAGTAQSQRVVNLAGENAFLPRIKPRATYRSLSGKSRPFQIKVISAAPRVKLGVGEAAGHNEPRLGRNTSSIQ